MKKADVVKQYTTPIAAPAFVQGPIGSGGENT
jgi:hypothetical protein